MRPTAKWILAVVGANVLLLPVTFTRTQKAAMMPQAVPGRYDCCRETAGRASFCCHKCCWLPSDCSRCLEAVAR